MKKIDNLDYEELEKEILELGEKKYKANQIYEWIHQKNITDFFDMTNLSKDTRKKLELNYDYTKVSLFKKFESKLDDTRKYLFLLDDDNIIESVYLKYKYGNTACISTQVGCKMGCIFCASTKNGLIRDLTTAEILGQVYNIQEDINNKISNIVIMGSGEPLNNYENVIRFLKIINSEKGQNISLRKITLSTCGIISGIYKLADEELPITLAISLHAATQEKREQIIPMSKVNKLDDLMKACDYYYDKTKRRITFEYIMIDNFNDKEIDSQMLSKLLKNRLCNVNLIPYNIIKENDISPSQNEQITKFKKNLLKNGINATIRRELGSDINAACGQLRNDFLNE